MDMKHKTRQVVTSKEANYKFHILWDYILTSEDARLTHLAAVTSLDHLCSHLCSHL